MGFRYRKRVNLGKGFGLNFSKKGMYPSYRSKKGSVSTKGFSIRTGIPGLTYRKNFNKSTGKGCLFVLVFLFCIPIIMISCLDGPEKHVSDNSQEWYVGGSLHKSKISEWKISAKRNKLATCGDFLAHIYKGHSLDFIKSKAIELSNCIDEAVKGHSLSDDNEVAEIASMCIVFMEQ
ncbi:hypothetical protein POV27_01555 [Aureisphaera galaxeae]|uniref:hypothetical protein n=1 Tax=Aureisphaera galaxeae TaxID=1538023 RepID=UPI00235037C9|nr:hypothetical protein [Aureisphaera galaxeae]MDC8002725.1 hypothetical protein [Aureisphaera galaxeae]